jgi:hypothetical protein
MTGAKWRACDDPLPMIRHLAGKAPARALRLFACACARRSWDRLTDGDRAVVEVAERHCDGLPVPRPLWQVVRAARPVGRILGPASLAALACGDYEEDAVIAAVYASRHAAEAASDPAAERAVQCDLLRDIVGDPFRPVEAESWWRTDAVVAAADAAHAGGDGSRLPALADLLEEAGCGDARVLGHLRGPGPHARGCWAVALLRTTG